MKNMIRTMVAAAAMMIVGAAAMMFSGVATADYVCQCVNGELAAIVSGNISVQPVCAPRVCPAPPGTSSMARNMQVSAQGGGGSDCAPRQVMDTVSGKYEWKVLCR